MNKEQFIDNLFGKMIIVVDRNQYSRYILFKIEDKIYMEYNQKNGYLWCDWYRIWSILMTTYGCNDLEIKQLINGKVEQHFKLNAVTPARPTPFRTTWVEQHLKLNAVTPTNAVFVQR